MGRLSHWLFDLDNTLYPSDCGLFDAIDGRINLYLNEFFGVAPGDADGVRRGYFHKYGLTLVGLMREYGADPMHYLEYVHRVPVGEYLRLDENLRATLEAIPVPKSIFTNGSRRHSLAVTGALGIGGCFEDVFDITALGYVPKPDPRSYRTVLDRLGVPAGAVAFVEDLPQNLLPAKELGMTTVLVGGEQGAEGADYVVESPGDLQEILPSLFS